MKWKFLVRPQLVQKWSAGFSPKKKQRRRLARFEISFDIQAEVGEQVRFFLVFSPFRHCLIKSSVPGKNAFIRKQ
jgi:hypothetical protein